MFPAQTRRRLRLFSRLRQSRFKEKYIVRLGLTVCVSVNVFPAFVFNPLLTSAGHMVIVQVNKTVFKHSKAWRVAQFHSVDSSEK